MPPLKHVYARVFDSVLARWCLGLVLFSIAGSLLSRLTGLNPGPIAPLASIATLGCLVVWAVRGLMFWVGGRTGIAVALVLGIGIVAEVVGLYTGYPFGRYVYTGRWLPSIGLPGGMNFPLLLPFAWLMVTSGAYLVVRRFASGIPAIFGTAFLAALVDLPMEWAMVVNLRYWEWTDPSWPIGDVGFGVPWLNSLGWLGVSLLAGWVFVACESHRGNEMPPKQGPWILGLQTALMVALGLLSFLPQPS